MTAIAHVPLAPRKTPCGSFTAPGLHIDGAAFEWLRAYLQREEARPPQGRAEEDVGHTSETGSTSDSLEGTDLSSPSLSSRARPTECDGAVPLSRPMSHDERLYEMDSVDIGQGTYKRRRKVGWSSTEDLAILATVRRLGTQWHRIAAQFPGRTSDAVRNRWHRLQKTHSLGDSKEGRMALDALLLACGVERDWALSPDQGSQSPHTECIKGSDHGRAMWTQHEDNLIEEGVRRYGLKWRQIAASLPGRSDSSVRNRWMRLQKEHVDVRQSNSSPLSPRKTSRSESPLKPLMAVPTSGQAALMMANAAPTVGSIGVSPADLARNPTPPRKLSGSMLTSVPLPPASSGTLPAVRHVAPGLEATRPPPFATATLKRRYSSGEELSAAKGRALTPLLGFDLMSFVEAVSGAIDTSGAVAAALEARPIPASAADLDNKPLVFVIDEMASVELFARSEHSSQVDFSPSPSVTIKRAVSSPAALPGVAALLGGLAALSIGVSVLSCVR